jgi:hypothetical protein
MKKIISNKRRILTLLLEKKSADERKKSKFIAGRRFEVADEKAS